MCLVLQFGAPLLVHPYVLLGTLELRDSYLFDISKLAMKPQMKSQEGTVKSYIRDVNKYPDYICMDLRKFVSKDGLERLVNKLKNLNMIIDVHLE